MSFRKTLLPGEEFQTDEPDAVEIRLDGGRLTGVQLGCRVMRGTDPGWFGFPDSLRPSQINDPNIAEWVNHDIGGLDVAVEISGGMKRFQTG